MRMRELLAAVEPLNPSELRTRHGDEFRLSPGLRMVVQIKKRRPPVSPSTGDCGERERKDYSPLQPTPGLRRVQGIPRGSGCTREREHRRRKREFLRARTLA